jgi:hypothetical protein
MAAEQRSALSAEQGQKPGLLRTARGHHYLTDPPGRLAPAGPRRHVEATGPSRLPVLWRVREITGPSAGPAGLQSIRVNLSMVTRQAGMLAAGQTSSRRARRGHGRVIGAIFDCLMINEMDNAWPSQSI